MNNNDDEDFKEFLQNGAEDSGGCACRQNFIADALTAKMKEIRRTIKVVSELRIGGTPLEASMKDFTEQLKESYMVSMRNMDYLILRELDALDEDEDDDDN
jgi:hypothetical protein